MVASAGPGLSSQVGAEKKMQSLTTRTLLLLLFGGLLASFVCAFCLFLVSDKNGKDKARESLEGYADLIAGREAERFEQIGAALRDATENLERAAPEFITEAALSPVDAALFDRLFPAAKDGTRRSSDSLFDGMTLPSGQYVNGFAAFIPGSDALTAQRKRLLLSAFRAMQANTSRIRQSLGNMVFVSGQGDIIAYGPGYEKALMVYRRYAKSNFDIFESGYIKRPGAPGALSCSDLLRFSARGASSSIAISCQMSAAMPNDVSGAFGVTLVTDDVFGQTYDHAVRSIDVFLVSSDGAFITAPQTARRQRLDIIGEPVEALADASAAWLVPVVENTAPSALQAATIDASETYFTVYRPLETPGWILAAIYPVSAVRVEALEQAGRLFGGGVLVTLFACLLTSMALRLGVSSPLKALAVQTDMLASTLQRYDGTAPQFDLPTQRRDEVGALARSFEVLARSAMAAQKIQQERYEKRTHQLADQTLSAREAQAATDALLARLSQDIRTHTNAIVGFTQILTEELPEGLQAQKRQYFAMLADNAEQLAELVDSVLARGAHPHEELTKQGDDEAA